MNPDNLLGALISFAFFLLVWAFIEYVLLEPRQPEEKQQCPTCGYYCLGKGGLGCINKPQYLEPRR